MKNCMKNTQNLNRILFIISSLNSGGAERVVSELANYFCQKKIEVYILLLSSDQIFYKISKKIKVIYACNEIKGYNRISDFFARVSIIKRYANKIKPVITISFLSTINIYSCLALGFSKNKLIVSERNDPKKSPSNKIKRTVRNLVYYLADGFVFQTHEAQNYFSKYIKKRSIVIPNPIKHDLPEIHIGERKKKIVAVGRLEEQKNYPLLIKSFKLISDDFNDYILEIYGDGRERKLLEKMINELQLNNRVYLMGVYSNVHERIKDAELYILTSHYEGMPNALMEAMALGLPCISVDCSGGGPRELINDGINGFIEKNNNEYSLSKKIRYVLKNKQLLHNISRNAVLVRKEYSLEKIGNKWLEYIISKTGSKLQ